MGFLNRINKVGPAPSQGRAITDLQTALYSLSDRNMCESRWYRFNYRLDFPSGEGCAAFHLARKILKKGLEYSIPLLIEPIGDDGLINVAHARKGSDLSPLQWAAVRHIVARAVWSRQAAVHRVAQNHNQKALFVIIKPGSRASRSTCKCVHCKSE